MLSSSRLRRSSAALVPALLLASLAACGSKTGYGDTTVAGLDSFTVTGDFGKTPTIVWNAEPSYPDSVQTKTLVTGTGPAIAPTDTIEASIYVADPLVDFYTARNACHASASSSASGSASASVGGSGGAGDSAAKGKKGSTAGKGSKGSTAAKPSATATADPSGAPSSSASAAPTPVTLTPCPDDLSFPVKGSWVYQSPSSQSLDMSQVSPVFQNALKGATIGSRVEVLAGSPDIFPAQQGGVPGQPSLGVGTRDPLVMVLDIVKVVPPLPDRDAHDVSPSTLPKVKLQKGKPVGFDWTGITKPAENATLKRATLKAGTGAVVKATDTVTVNYLGMTYKATKPFDESYTKKPATFGLGGVVEGWKTGLTGVKVGSRVVLQIPPTLGYGSQAQAGIPADSTLYFVVDVISAKPAKK